MAPALLQAAALALRASAIICPTTPTCPQDDQCTYADNGVSLQVSCATDFYGGDLQSTQTSSLTDCMNACAENTSCVAVSYVSGTCYLKSTLESGQANNNVIGAAVLSRPTTTSVTATSSVAATTSAAAATPVASTTPVTTGTAQACPASYTCPENNGCTFQSADSRTFALYCGIDFYGGDLGSMSAASLDDCNQACADNAQCVAASFVGGKGAGQCYLKNENKGAVANSNVDGFALVTASATSSASSSTLVSTDAASSTSANVASSTSSQVVLSTSSALATSSSVVRVSSTASSTSSPASSSMLSSSSPTPKSVTSSTPSSTMTTLTRTTSTLISTLISTSTSTRASTLTSTVAPTPTQVLSNGGFESGSGNAASPWTFQSSGLLSFFSSTVGRVNSDARSGSYSFQVLPSTLSLGTTTTLKQTVTVVPGKAYDVSIWGKSSSLLSACSVSIYYNNALVGASGSIQVATFGTAYTQTVRRVTADMTASGSGTLQFTFACTGTLLQSKLFVDDITMTQV